MKFIENIATASDNVFGVGVFSDLCKTFATTDHSILQYKWERFGERDAAHVFFRNLFE